MTSYVIGNIIGRALFAYLLVWLSVFIYKKFKYKLAFKVTNSVRGCVAVGLIFTLPLLNNFGAAL